MGMENQNVAETPLTETPPAELPETQRRQRLIIAGLVVVLIIILVGLGFAIYALATHPDTAVVVRDIFIIFMALESLVLGLVLTILVVQIARLTNLLQNEIKPILESTNETVDTLRGTTIFLSENLVQPVMKLNEYLAALQKMAALIGIGRKKTNK